MATCHSCNAEVVLVPSQNTGKAMILDAKPRKGVVLVADSASMHGMYGFAEAVADWDTRAKVVDVYTDHHATCPNAKDWRR